MNLDAVVREVAGSMQLLDDDGTLKGPLDSMTIVELVIALEHRVNVRIPLETMRLASFERVDQIVAVLAAMRDPAAVARERRS
jgi:acyl carrier protein